MLKDFLALSRILTGVEDLDEELGRQYLDRLASSPCDPFLRQILDHFRGFRDDENVAERVKQEILGDGKLRPTVCQIILLWYTSAMRDSESATLALRYGTQEAYFSGLVWNIIGAHPPGLSGDYFGHWRYPSENGPTGTLK